MGPMVGLVIDCIQDHRETVALPHPESVIHFAETVRRIGRPNRVDRRGRLVPDVHLPVATPLTIGSPIFRYSPTSAANGRMEIVPQCFLQSVTNGRIFDPPSSVADALMIRSGHKCWEIFRLWQTAPIGESTTVLCFVQSH